MQITCVICEELFTGEGETEIFATTCGHLFHLHCLTEWLGRSNSCPQCRQKTSKKKLQRIFFNQSDTNPSHTNGNDSSAVASLIEGLEEKLLEKDSKIELLETQRKDIIKKAQKIRQELMAIEGKLKEFEQEVCSMQDDDEVEVIEQPLDLSCEKNSLQTVNKIQQSDPKPLEGVSTASTSNKGDNIGLPLRKVSSQSRIIKKAKKKLDNLVTLDHLPEPVMECVKL